MTVPATEFQRQDLRRLKRNLLISASASLVGFAMWSLSALLGEGAWREVVQTVGIILAGSGLAGAVGFAIVVSIFAMAFRLHRPGGRADRS